MLLFHHWCHVGGWSGGDLLMSTQLKMTFVPDGTGLIPIQLFCAGPMLVLGPLTVSNSIPFLMTRCVEWSLPTSLALQNAFSQRNTGIDSVYVDGVSITHCLPHSPSTQLCYWSCWRSSALDHDSICLCSLNSTNIVPTFVGNNYFCDTGTIMNDGQNTPYLDDPLWDGQGCRPSSAFCSLNSPPWFNAWLPNATTDSIEVRISADTHRSTEDLFLESLVIYIR